MALGDRIISDLQTKSADEDITFDPATHRMLFGKVVPKEVGQWLIDESKYQVDIDGYQTTMPPAGAKKQTKESYQESWLATEPRGPRNWSELQKYAYGNQPMEDVKKFAEDLGAMTPEERQKHWENEKTVQSGKKYAPFEAIVGVPENTLPIMKQLSDYMELGWSKEGAKAQIERDFIGSQVIREHNQKAEDWSFQKVVFLAGAIATGAEWVVQY